MKQVNTLSLFTACKMAVAAGGGAVKLSDHETVIVASASEFLEKQAQLEKAGYKLEDYNEYFASETWSRGKRSVTIKLEEE